MNGAAGSPREGPRCRRRTASSRRRRARPGPFSPRAIRGTFPYLRSRSSIGPSGSEQAVSRAPAVTTGRRACRRSRPRRRQAGRAVPARQRSAVPSSPVQARPAQGGPCATVGGDGWFRTPAGAIRERRTPRGDGYESHDANVDSTAGGPARRGHRGGGRVGLRRRGAGLGRRVQWRCRERRSRRTFRRPHPHRRPARDDGRRRARRRRGVRGARRGPLRGGDRRRDRRAGRVLRRPESVS